MGRWIIFVQVDAYKALGSATVIGEAIGLLNRGNGVLDACIGELEAQLLRLGSATDWASSGAWGIATSIGRRSIGVTGRTTIVQSACWPIRAISRLIAGTRALRSEKGKPDTDTAKHQ